MSIGFLHRYAMPCPSGPPVEKSVTVGIALTPGPLALGTFRGLYAN